MVAAIAFVLALATSSCRLDPVSPRADLGLATAPGATPASAPRHTGDDPASPTSFSNQAVVPEITRLRAGIWGTTLIIRGQLAPRDAAYSPFYSPTQPGGWMLQVFLNTGPDDPGYWRNYDYIVRGGEWSPRSGTLVIRHITLDPDTPGGWGPQSGLASFVPRPRSFEIAVPVGAVGGFDGTLDLCVETYATVACPDCADGVGQESVDDYFMTVDDVRPLAQRFVRTQRLAALVAGAPRTLRRATDADLRLALRPIAAR